MLCSKATHLIFRDFGRMICTPTASTLMSPCSRILSHRGIGDSRSLCTKKTAWDFLSPVALQFTRPVDFVRTATTSPEAGPEGGEERIRRILEENFPGAVEIEVNDVSGGCGSMYAIYVEAEEFRGKKILEQQKMVNSVLEKEIKAMHGLTLQTAVPSKEKPKSPPE